jgi:hypothetical protein
MVNKAPSKKSIVQSTVKFPDNRTNEKAPWLPTGPSPKPDQSILGSASLPPASHAKTGKAKTQQRQ